MDIDDIKDPEELKEKIAKSKVPATLMFKSPSGNGLKVIVVVEGGEKMHLSNFYYYENHLKRYYNIQIDRSCKDVARACLLCHDKNVYFRDPDELDPIQLENTTDRLILKKARKMILDSKDGDKHSTLLNVSRLLGGYSASNLISANLAISESKKYIKERGNIDDFKLAEKTIIDGFNHGLKSPLTEDDLYRFDTKYNEQCALLTKKESNPVSQFITEYSDFVFDNLPNEITKIINRFSSYSDRSYLLFILIGFLPNLFTRFRLSYNGTLYGLNLGVVAVALSASGKSASNFIKGLFEPIHKKLNKEKEVFGSKKTLFLPANISAIELAERIRANGGTGTIYSTEISEFTSTIEKDFGDYDYLLRQGLSNEVITIMRKTDKTDINIEFPVFNFCLTGTHSQFPKMYKDINNGFFSRMMYFMLSSSNDWNRGNSSRKKANNSDIQDFLVEKYNHYLKCQPEFRFSTEVEQYFDDEMEKLSEKYIYDDLMTSVVRRSGIYIWKIARMFKLMEQNYSNDKVIDIDLTTMKICFAIVRESVNLSEYLSFQLKATGISDEERIVNKLKSFKREFTRAEALSLVDGIVSVRTIDRILKKTEYFIKTGHGKYKAV